MDSTLKRTWDLPAVVLMMAILWTAAMRLWVTEWTSDLEKVELLVMLGWLLGTALGKSRFHYKAVRWIGFLYTMILIPWQLGLTMEESVRWAERLPSVMGRLWITFTIFINNQPVQDPILFIASMCLLFWLISVIASYQLVRYGRPWVPVAVAGIAVLLIEYYHPFILRKSILTGVFFFFTLMLIGRMHYLYSRERWEKNNINVDAEAGFDLSRSTILAGLVLVVMAWNFPAVIRAVTPGTAEQKWVTVSWQGLRNRLSNMVVSLRSPVSSSNNDFGNSLGLGTGAQLGDETTLLIALDRSLPEEIRLYWRGHSYDQFAGFAWNNTLSDLQAYEVSNEPFYEPSWSPLQRVNARIETRLGFTSTLYFPGQPLVASRPGKAQWQTIPEEGIVDVVSVIAEPGLRSGEVYDVTGAVATPTIFQLKQSTGAYPQWVLDRYLQLPENMSPRIAALAAQITRGYEDPYDKVTAITNYLRDNIQYSDTIPNPPNGQDAIDWFLFDHRQGYCNYYATAEILMLRSIGIPARLAVGYAEGQPSENRDVFLVQRKDSHAWPEVFFEGAGWVPFEPTVSQPELVLPAGGEENQNDLSSGGSASDESLGDFASRGERFLEDPGDFPGAFGAATPVQRFPYEWVVLGLVLLAISGFFLYRNRQQARGRWKPVPLALEISLRRRGVQVPAWLVSWARFSELTSIERLFAGVAWMLRILGGKMGQATTPAEQIATLVTLLPEGRENAGVVLGEYQRSVYSPYPPDVDHAREASNLLWRQVLRAWVRRRFGFEIQVT